MGRAKIIPKKIHSFINYDDFIEKAGGRRAYKASCKECGADRGYKRPNKLDAVCNLCQKKIMRSHVTQKSRALNWKHRREKGLVIPWNKRRSPEHVRLRHCVSSLVYSRLRKRSATKGKSFFISVGYSFEELVVHLESKFQSGMTWGNYGKWHVDHIRPDSLFTYKSMDDDGFKNSWKLNNLQPLWAVDNLRKSDKVT